MTGTDRVDPDDVTLHEAFPGYSIRVRGEYAGSIEVKLRHGETVVTTNNAVHPAAEHILETEGFDRDDLPIVLAVFRIFRGILEEHGDELQLYRKNSESASGLDPEGESRKLYSPTAHSFGRDGPRGPVGRKHGGCTNSRRSIRRAPERPSSTIGRGWAESSQRGRTPVESGTALSPFRTMEVPTPKREAATLRSR